jgi:hypothetical protein
MVEDKDDEGIFGTVGGDPAGQQGAKDDDDEEIDDEGDEPIAEARGLSHTCVIENVTSYCHYYKARRGNL